MVLHCRPEGPRDSAQTRGRAPETAAALRLFGSGVRYEIAVTAERQKRNASILQNLHLTCEKLQAKKVLGNHLERFF